MTHLEAPEKLQPTPKHQTLHTYYGQNPMAGGAIGGSYNNPPTYTGNAYEGQFTPPVIMNEYSTTILLTHPNTASKQ